MREEKITKEDVESCIRDLESAFQECVEKYERLMEIQTSYADEEMKELIELGFIIGRFFKFNCDLESMKHIHGDVLTVSGYTIGCHVRVKFTSKMTPEQKNYGLNLEAIKKYPERLIKLEGGNP